MVDPAEFDAQRLISTVRLVGLVVGPTAYVFVLALVAPTLFVNEGTGSWAPWVTTAAAVVAAGLFVLRECAARHPLVSSGLAFKAAAGVPTARLGYMVTLQLQLDWDWSPALAALGMLLQVVVLVAGGAFITSLVRRVSLAWRPGSAP